MPYHFLERSQGAVVQINIRIGAGAVLMTALLAAGFWYVNGRAWPLQWRQISAGATDASPNVPQFMPTNGGLLTIAWVKGYETFVKRSPSDLDLGFAKMPLPWGDTVSEISTAARYQYQIRLEKRWPMRCSKTACEVRTGDVELAEPVAIYHEETTRKTASGWARFDKAENLEALNKSLGRELAQRGNLPRNRDVGLRDGRAEIEKFVREWMVEKKYGDRKIIVLYPGEKLVDGKPVAAD
jgi:hypothetical protein